MNDEKKGRKKKGFLLFLITRKWNEKHRTAGDSFHSSSPHMFESGRCEKKEIYIYILCGEAVTERDGHEQEKSIS